MKITAADVDRQIDRLARQRLTRAMVLAKCAPTPENVAALREWPEEWVKSEEGSYGPPRDRRSQEVTRYMTFESDGELKTEVLQAPPERTAAAETPENPKPENWLGRAKRILARTVLLSWRS